MTTIALWEWGVVSNWYWI